jgi:hypothetical protein
MDKAEPSVEPTTAMPAIKIGLYAAFTRVGRSGFEPVTLGFKVRAEPSQQTVAS